MKYPAIGGISRLADQHQLMNTKRKSTGLKRPKTPDEADIRRFSKKSSHDDDMLAQSPSPRSSGYSSKEPSNSVNSEEGVVLKEPSMYGNLLMALGSGSTCFSDMYKRRLREEARRSHMEIDDGGLECLVSEEEVGSEGGSDDKSSWSHAMRNEGRACSPVDLVEQSEEAEVEDLGDASDTDHAHDLEINGQTVLDASEGTSSFSDHLGHTLTEAEVDNFLKRKWKFKWEAPAVGMSMSKWVGTRECLLKDVGNNSFYGLKQKLYKHWLDIYKSSGFNDFHSSNQRLFFSLCNSYQDIMHVNKKPFYLKGQVEDSSIMDAYIMHALNHVYRTRDVVTKNNAKLAKHRESMKENFLNGDGFRDHGFTRPKVLILLPLRSIALRVIKRLIELTPQSHRVNVEHIDRFYNEFGSGEIMEYDDKNDISSTVHDAENSKSQKSSKPPDFHALFGGNNNDLFMIGIKFTRKSIKLYSDFYSSDMIVASPLGLFTKIVGAVVEKGDGDFLSSIELLIIDHSDIIAMQNWSHLNTVVDLLNRKPSEMHGTDIMRIRKWYLYGDAKFYRQTILLGSFLTPDMNALFNSLCFNHEGKVKLVSEYKGVLPKVLLQVRQVYERFDHSIINADDARLDYFAKKVFPKIKDSIQGGTMIFVSSYFEFVRIRNFLKSQNASFCMLGEYIEQSEISRARVWFFGGRRKIMLYTERAHFYHRYKIRGMQNLIIYSLPERKEFYPEILNMFEGSQNTTSTILFSRFDYFRLERIVGSAAAKRMLSSKKDIFAFC